MYLRNCTIVEPPMDISICNPRPSGIPHTGLLYTGLLQYGHLGNCALAPRATDRMRGPLVLRFCHIPLDRPRWLQGPRPITFPARATRDLVSLAAGLE